MIQYHWDAITNDEVMEVNNALKIESQHNMRLILI
eukprot:CAMPEP_0174330432 /NCGR_PEP_ID=MMETSP0810-20121108/16674_1 /TAXON_ID=73025 ORGANISM="Eutreptiella gymnastica-like, Strain CCMP1594" /NCGR_SAMPLE_ID=MMETSP0810 /ASSEMBLY_ACC=CAM_ASM_000659 /LENGTH=34 /DNA_ID= /DNA_START= /DNA_END= /DNA_ORIENTATION=